MQKSKKQQRWWYVEKPTSPTKKEIVGNGPKLRFQQHWWEAKFKGTPTLVTCRKRRITQQIFAVAVVVIVNKKPNLRFHQRW